jgi:hypothetical protein
MNFVWPVLWFALGGIVAYAWVSMRLRIRRALEVPPPQIDDDDVRRIVERGFLITDDPAPLDLEQIRREEEDFWGESWDEAEEL